MNDSQKEACACQQTRVLLFVFFSPTPYLPLVKKGNIRGNIPIYSCCIDLSVPLCSLLCSTLTPLRPPTSPPSPERFSQERDRLVDKTYPSGHSVTNLSPFSLIPSPSLLLGFSLLSSSSLHHLPLLFFSSFFPNQINFYPVVSLAVSSTLVWFLP